MTNQSINLRAPEPDDIDMIYRLENDPEIRSASWGEAPFSRQMIWEYLKNYKADIYSERQLRMIITLGDVPVGIIDLFDFSPTDLHAFVGIAIDINYRNQGYGEIALRKLMEFCRFCLNLHQLCAIVQKSNKTSISLFNKLKFKTSGCLKSWVKKGNMYEDALIMQYLFP